MTVGQEGSLSTGHANSPPDMLRRLETMILMAGYEMPLKTIREQIASAVDLIVHTARLGDGSRKIVNITEVYGIEDDQILTQDIFVFEQTGVDQRGKIVGDLKPTGVRPTFMPKFAASGIDLPPDEFGIPPEDPSKPAQQRVGKGRSIGIDSGESPKLTFGLGRVVVAGGMAYVSSVGPVVPDTGRLVGDAMKAQARQCLENLKARLAEAGSSLDRIALANWSLKDPADFETFNEEWVRWFPGDGPVGQLTIMPPQHRRAGFRVSLGAIAETDGSVPSGALPAPVVLGQVIVTEPPIRLLPSGVETDRRKGQRRRSLPAEAAAELVPAEGERRRGDRRKRTGD
jgi:enamine deaminase RidA (YjgF/YER057c/UK114 family)